MLTKTKLDDLKGEAQKAVADAREIAEKALESGWTDDMTADYDRHMAKGKDLLEQIKVAKRDRDLLDAAKAMADEIGLPESAKGDIDEQGRAVPVRERVKSLGLQVVESPEFKAMMSAFPDGRVPEKSRVQSSPIAMKGLFVGGNDTSAGAFVVPDQSGIVETLGRKPLVVRDLVSVRRTGSDVVEYIEQTAHTNAAAPVPEATSSAAPTAPGSAGPLVRNPDGGYKPEGSWSYARRQANVKTIAEWVPATKRSLSDVGALEGLINDELALDVKDAEERQLLVGDGSGENFTGINSWSGVQTQAFTTDLFTTTRKAITKARVVGRVNPNAWVMNPTDAETIDLLRNAQGDFYYGGPFAIGQRTLWGRPIVEAEDQPAGVPLLGDFSKAVVWDREQTTVTISDSHEDFFTRNMVAVLAEERLAFAVTRPTAFVKVALS